LIAYTANELSSLTPFAISTAISVYKIPEDTFQELLKRRMD